VADALFDKERRLIGALFEVLDQMMFNLPIAHQA